MAEQLQELFRQSVDAGDDSWLISFVQEEYLARAKGDAGAERAKGGEQNRWRVSKVGENTDTLTMTAAVIVTTSDFFKANPDAQAQCQGDPAKLAPAGDYRLRHASTGETDGDWRLREFDREKNRLVLTRDYDCQVEHRDAHNGLVEAVPGTNPALRERIERKLAELPPNVVSALEAAGYKIILCNWIEDALPSLKGLTPRGWDKDQTFRNSDGTEDNVSRRIIIPAKWVVDGRETQARRLDEVVHQIGHALDFAHGAGPGFLSAETAFVTAYEREIARLDKNDEVVRYFGQPGGIGRQEVFATLFGLALTGPEVPSMRQWLSDSFPETLSVVRSQTKKLK